MDKITEKVRCIVCNKKFVTSFRIVSKRGNYAVVVADDFICSEACRRIDEKNMEEQIRCMYSLFK